MAGSELEAAVQELSPLIELAEVHIAEAQVVEEIGIFGILAEELLQVDAGLVEAGPEGMNFKACSKWLSIGIVQN